MSENVEQMNSIKENSDCVDREGKGEYKYLLERNDGQRDGYIGRWKNELIIVESIAFFIQRGLRGRWSCELGRVLVYFMKTVAQSQVITFRGGLVVFW